MLPLCERPLIRPRSSQPRPQWEAVHGGRHGSAKSYSAASPGTSSGRSASSGGGRTEAARDGRAAAPAHADGDDEVIDAKGANGMTLAKMDRKTFSAMLTIYNLHWCGRRGEAPPPSCARAPTRRAGLSA